MELPNLDRMLLEVERFGSGTTPYDGSEEQDVDAGGNEDER